MNFQKIGNCPRSSAKLPLGSSGLKFARPSLCWWLVMDLGDFGEEGQVWRTKGWIGKLECEEPAIIEEPAHVNATSVRHIFAWF